MNYKLKSFLILLLCLLLALSCAGCVFDISDILRYSDSDSGDEDEDEDEDDEDETVLQTAAPAHTYDNLSGWTVMLYLNGSNLESDGGEATSNLLSILSIPIPPSIHVLVYTGGTKDWQNDLIDPQKNQIWEVKDGGLELLKSTGKKSIGESDTLAEFLSYGQSLYPGTRRALFLWNHGAGSIAGFGCDEHFNEDQLYLYEMDEAFKSSFDGQKYELVGFDACLMACVETAAMLEPYAKYMVASEETEPGGGWNYEYTFGALRDNPNISGLELGIAITDGYYSKYEYTEWESMTTCSVIDLSLVPQLVEMLGMFSAGLSDGIKSPESLSTIASARQRTESYGDSPGSVSYDLVDLYNFVELQRDTNPTLSDDLLAAIENAVVYEVSGSQRTYSFGLSIYFPFSAVDYFPYCLDIYSEFDFCDEYYSFIDSFAAELTSQSYLSFVPEYDPELEETGEQDPLDEEPLYYVQLSSEEWEYMSYVYCALGWVVNSDVVIDLGFDSDVNIDYDNYTVYDDFDCSWTGLNGNLVSLFVMEETDEYVLYKVPVLYNGKKAIVSGSWIWDSSNAEGGYYKYNGIYYANEDFSVPNTKMTIALKSGDKITPTFTTLFSGSGYQGYYEGDTFTIDDTGLYLGLIWLPDGDYYYGFLFIDNYGEVHYTEYTPIEVWTE